MVSHVENDTSYLVAPKARDRIGGYYPLSNYPTVTKRPRLNGAILIEYKTLRHVLSSVVEVEVVGVFHNAQMTILIRIILEVMDHSQL